MQHASSGRQGPAAGGGDVELQAALAALWRDAQPHALERVTVLEEAVAALLTDTLNGEVRDRARREAHKLAGALGTFGMPEGTDHARAVEHRLEAGVTPADALVLAEHVTALRRVVQSGGESATAEDGAAGVARPADVLIVGLPGAQAGELIAALRERGVAAAAHRAEGAWVALAAGPAHDLGAAVESLAAGGATVAVLLAGDGGADRVDLVRRGAARLLPTTLGIEALADELAGLVAARRETADRVLAVDDDPNVLAAIDALLRAEGHEVATLADPRDFWPALERTRPAIVVLDLDMPGVDGIALCRTLRADARWGATPVLFLTASTASEAISGLFAAGADDYVPKPFVGPELAARVRSRLERTRLLRDARETDPVTGLELRGAAQARLRRLRGHADRLRQPLTLSVVLLDAPDADVHAADAMLAAAGRALLPVLGPEDVGARWRDDELLVAQLGLGEHDVRQVIAGALSELAGEADGVAGVAEYPRDGADIPAVHAAARGAAVAARAQGSRVLAHGWQDEEPDRVDVAVVEDDEALAAVVLHALGTRGYRTRRITEGDEAAELLGGPRPRLSARVVLLDWDLPGRDGLTILRGLAADGGLAGTRVIMLTARASEREVLTALELGAADHIAKPVTLPVLMQKVRRALGPGQSGRD